MDLRTMFRFPRTDPVGPLMIRLLSVLLLLLLLWCEVGPFEEVELKEEEEVWASAIASSSSSSSEPCSMAWKDEAVSQHGVDSASGSKCKSSSFFSSSWWRWLWLWWQSPVPPLQLMLLFGCWWLTVRWAMDGSWSSSSAGSPCCCCCSVLLFSTTVQLGFVETVPKPLLSVLSEPIGADFWWWWSGWARKVPEVLSLVLLVLLLVTLRSTLDEELEELEVLEVLLAASSLKPSSSSSSEMLYDTAEFALSRL